MIQADGGSYSFKPLAKRLWREAFSCGVIEIDRWFIKKSWDDHDKFRCRVTTVHNSEDDVLVGFYAFCMTLEPESDLEKASHLRRFAVGKYFPTLQVHYLAVHKEFQQRGIGTIAMGKIIHTFREVAILTGIPVMTLRAIDKHVAKFYSAMGFVSYGRPGDLRMLLPAQSVLDLVHNDEGSAC